MIGPILGIETTCDETSAAVLDREGQVASLVVHSQDMHRVHGGVVPELAARDHLRRIEPVAATALAEAGVAREELEAVAVAAGPGLIGALLVGMSWSRATAFALDVPLIPVHHMEAHLFGPLLEDPDATPPFVALLVSGGHTLLLWTPEWGRYFLMGQTRDDAAGEAFDKVAKLLDLPYPGGPAIEREAARGDPARYRFPRPLAGKRRAGDRFDFSFSGLKTAVGQAVTRLVAEGPPERVAQERPHLAVAFQEAAVDVLAAKTLDAAGAVGCRRVLLGGGVSANGALRERVRAGLGAEGRLFASSPRLALDNGAMIARVGQFRFDCGSLGGMDQASARAEMPGAEPWRPDSTTTRTCGSTPPPVAAPAPSDPTLE